MALRLAIKCYLSKHDYEKYIQFESGEQVRR